jgi:hypothetical protein
MVVVVVRQIQNEAGVGARSAVFVLALGSGSGWGGPLLSGLCDEGVKGSREGENGGLGAVRGGRTRRTLDRQEKLDYEAVVTHQRGRACARPNDKTQNRGEAEPHFSSVTTKKSLDTEQTKLTVQQKEHSNSKPG